MQQHQAPVKKDGKKPDAQRKDKKKADEIAMKLSKRMDTMRFVMAGWAGAPVFQLG